MRHFLNLFVSLTKSFCVQTWFEPLFYVRVWSLHDFGRNDAYKRPHNLSKCPLNTNNFTAHYNCLETVYYASAMKHCTILVHSHNISLLHYQSHHHHHHHHPKIIINFVDGWWKSELFINSWQNMIILLGQRINFESKPSWTVNNKFQAGNH